MSPVHPKTSLIQFERNEMKIDKNISFLIPR